MSSKKVNKETIEVESSAISRVTYDFKHKRLFVVFSSDTLYSYENIPDEVFYNIKFSDSIGKAFRKLIRGKYEYTRLV